ncbi:hypothetical protein AQUCO_00500062v1 [Aquilegia coerulea]|uniref:SAM-dependent methyltransferase TRM5/TYW2-type domain-containing protein n=1 Tax=Aquilegia coerulea TaxID=218851 RepID=A0A2G5EQ57_AQUCA|nr:hypothetical protein AQUCO_00500062v1 [Aquilegia coerulea]PIA57885.1 hypothetical protein AQUCO_00500062v1 [Aquilegia coerulea]
MEFEKRKAATLSTMSSTEIDKSPKGTLDIPILPLLKTLNLHPSYFTTSSCSGRISILSQPSLSTSTTTTTTTIKKKAKGGTWVFITHELADPNSVIDLLFPLPEANKDDDGELVFRFEPFILAVECKDVESAQTLVATAISCGFRESGITSIHKRVIIAIRCSIRLEVPLGSIGKMMVSRDYVRYLVGIANEKMEMNRKRTECFLQVLESKLLENQVLWNGVVKKKKNELVGTEEQFVCSAECDGNSDLSQLPVENCDLEREDSNAELGLLDAPGCSISVAKMLIVGEPIDKLFLWGHSACTINNSLHRKILIFGGFGGVGRHARRNDILMLEPLSGTLELVSVEGPPSPRLGHTSSVVGENVFVIGGRGDPTNILNDVWVFNTNKNEWKLHECSGSVFHPRHRHAAAVMGSKIYVFGGLNKEIIYSSMYVLDTELFHWSEIDPKSEWPCARHSHALVKYDTQLYMFGGYDGEKALCDIYSFDTTRCLWKKQKTAGRLPLARFSHSMFVYKNYLGIVGGCPVRQHYEEMALLDLQLGSWKHVILSSVGKDLFVRSTSHVVGDDLVIIGGGASCYAFGTKFSEPVKISLPRPTTFSDTINPRMNEMHSTCQPKKTRGNGENSITLTEICNFNYKTEFHEENLDIHKDATQWVLQLEKKNAKMGKDVLKKFGWLDVGRKVYSSDNRIHIFLPVTESFCTLFHEKQKDWIDSLDGLNDHDPCKTVNIEKLSVHDIPGPIALNKLLLLGGRTLKDEVACIRSAPKSPQKVMSEAVRSLMLKRGLPLELLEEIPTRWERLGDIVVLPMTSFKDPLWNNIREELWPTVAKSFNTCRLARQGRIASTGTRDSTLDMLVGDDGWVDHCENRILYSFDATKCMFSWGNLSEKLRMARLDCEGEVIVDLFAGIGYFVLPFLVRAKAKMVYACEWNPHALEALRRNVQSNAVADRCVILEGDNRATAPKGVADRVCLGLLPSSEDSWVTAVRALRIEGGMLHVHGNAKDSEESIWSDHVAKTIHDIAKSEGYCWEVSLQHLEKVKWYGPHIRHLVADIRCKQV